MAKGNREIPLIALLFCALSATPRAQTFTTVWNFNGANGNNPESSLIQGFNGGLYGTTSAYNDGDGTIFGIGQSGFRVLFKFDGLSDGRTPIAALTLATDGNFYGATSGIYYLPGTIFKIDQSGNLTTLYTFCSQPNCADGAYPFGTLAEGIDGNFYGTTQAGGHGSCSDINYNGCGTVFKITPTGNLTTLHSFSGYPMDGSLVSYGLVQASDGNFYGTTVYGGAVNVCEGTYPGCGTIFRITPSGGFATIHSFEFTDGGEPDGSLIQGTDGDLYGTTSIGGGCSSPNSVCGTVFQLAPTGLTTLFAFCTTASCEQGTGPNGGLVQGTDGNFYGTTLAGGLNSEGTVFQITPQGSLTSLYSFCSVESCEDGEWPEAGLFQATNGAFYGTTYTGGTRHCLFGTGCGTVFSLSTGLAPFVSFVHPVSRVGQNTGMLGQGFTGTTSVSFNGTAATFTVRSDTFLTATVPAGATTGYVTVTTSTGTLTSNVPFHVLP